MLSGVSLSGREPEACGQLWVTLRLWCHQRPCCAPTWRGAQLPQGPTRARPNSPVLLPQPSDFSVSLKASGKNKHFKVQLVDNVYCIGQRRFHSMDELVEHYKKAPIFTSEHGEKLYLVRALQ